MSETTSERTSSDVDTAPPVRWPAPERRRRSPARGVARRGRAPSAQPFGGRFVAGLLLMAAVAGGALGVQGSIQASHARSRVASLQGQVTSLERRLDADEQGAASARTEIGKVAGRATGVDRSVSRTLARINWSLQSVPSEGQLASLRGALDAYAACVGELQSEISRLGISWRINPDRPSADYFKLFTAAPASGACSSASTGR